MIETNRLKIYAALNEQMERFISEQSVDVLKAAYTEMLDGCRKHPNQRAWHAIWMIELKDGTHVGEMCFKGLNADGSAEIGYGIADEYQAKKLGTYYLRFDSVDEESALYPYIHGTIYTGSLGESYSILNTILQDTVRIYCEPSTLYDAMMFVYDATPLELLDY